MELAARICQSTGDGIPRAHLFGASLGGIIAQRIALRHPDRVLSVVSDAGIPSDASGLGAFRYIRLGMLTNLSGTWPTCDPSAENLPSRD